MGCFADLTEINIQDCMECRIANLDNLQLAKTIGYYGLMFYMTLEVNSLPMGSTQIMVNREEKTADWISFFPFEYWSSYRGRLGWGAIAHVQSLAELVERERDIADFRVRHPIKPKQYRQRQLERMGINYKITGLGISGGIFEEEFPRYYQKSLRYLQAKGFDAARYPSLK